MPLVHVGGEMGADGEVIGVSADDARGIEGSKEGFDLIEGGNEDGADLAKPGDKFRAREARQERGIGIGDENEQGPFAGELLEP